MGNEKLHNSNMIGELHRYSQHMLLDVTYLL
jgi:hypothetical protein